MQADIFTCDIPKQWDFVYSLGLLEHFENTTQVLSKHLDFTAENGTMMVLIPNFRGLNGWLQKTFDRENYDIHNIACMNINYLKSCCRDLPVSNLNVYYYGKSGVWLENKKPHSAFVKLMFKLASYSSKLLTTILPFESKFLSPYIVIVANKTTK